jgi:hypothetical protein
MRARAACFTVAALLATASASAQEVAPPPGGCHYDIAVLDAEARALDVAMACDGNGPFHASTFRTLTDAHLRDVRGLGGSEVVKGEQGWTLKGASGVARATYRFDVDELVGSTNMPTLGQRVGGSIVASPRSFLLVPEGGRRPMNLTLRFRAPPGAAVVTGLAREGELERLHSGEFPYIGFMAMGRTDVLRLAVPGRNGAKEGTLTVAILDGPRALANAELARWIGTSAERVAGYFGGFPTARGLIVLQPLPGLRNLRRGIVTGGGGATMLLRIGADTRPEDLFEQWMLMHELVHFGAPFIDDHAWLMEGMAVYLETRLRVAAGWFPADLAWRGFLRSFRRGIPAMEQEGLAYARGIGPTYWGGTLFMLLADVAILERTKGAKSLADCFKAVLDEGGDTSVRWTAERFIAVCDRATGGATLKRLADAHVWKGTRLDLATVLARLGVQLGEYEASVKYDDAAPLAWVRKRIMHAPTELEGVPPRR